MISAFGVDHGISKAYGRGPAMDAARWTAGIAGTGAASGETIYQVERKKNKSKSDAKKMAAAGVLGGLTGQGIYQTAGYEAKHRASGQEAKAGLSRSKKDKKLKPVKAKYGNFTAKMYRNYPKDLPGAKINRVLSWTHRGRSGTALGTAITIGAGSAATAVARRAKEKS